jgi:hypothetical protein
VVARIAGQASGVGEKGSRDRCTGLVEPVERQVDAPAARVFADIAGNVGELHGKAQIGSTGQHRAVADPHDQRHHHANGGGDAGRIGTQLVAIAVGSVLDIPFKALDQSFRQRAWQGVMLDHGDEGAVCRMVARGSAIDRIKPGADLRQPFGRVGAFIDQIVGGAAKGIERAGRHPGGSGQQHRGCEERLRAGTDRFLAFTAEHWIKGKGFQLTVLA